MGMVTAPQICGRQESAAIKLRYHKKALQAVRQGLRSNARQLGDIRCNPPRLMARQQLAVIGPGSSS
jgi:hypothetical protein